MRRTIQCPMCGNSIPLPSGRKNSHLRSASQRGSAPRQEVLRVDDLVLNLATYDASRAGNEIALNRTEFRLLKSLMQPFGRVVARNALVQSVWDSNDDANHNLLDVTINHLRKKVDRDHKVKLIKTVRNLDYVIRDPAKIR